MLAVLDDIVQTLQQIKSEIFLLVGECMEELEPVIREMNQEQLDRGLRRDGSQLPDYAPSSVARGKTPGPMILKKTGAFWEGISVTANPTFAEIIGLDPKTGLLEAKYELTIIGIPDDRQEEFFRGHLLPILQDKIRARYFRI